MNNLDLLNPPEWYIITCSNCSCTVLVESYPTLKDSNCYDYVCYCNKCNASFQMNEYINYIKINDNEFRAYSGLTHYSFINGDDTCILITYYLRNEYIDTICINDPNINSYDQINKIFLDFVKKYLDNIIFE